MRAYSKVGDTKVRTSAGGSMVLEIVQFFVIAGAAIFALFIAAAVIAVGILIWGIGALVEATSKGRVRGIALAGRQVMAVPARIYQSWESERR